VRLPVSPPRLTDLEVEELTLGVLYVAVERL
jgi:hypothetical protein